MGSKRLETEARVAVTEETTERGMAATPTGGRSSRI
jgi:hypothetical protein